MKVTQSSDVVIREKQRRRRRVSVSNIFVAAILLMIGFAAGTRSQEIYAAIGPMFGIRVSADTLNLASVQRTFQALDVNYDGKLDKQALVDGANRGMVEAAGDKYTVFMSAKEAEEFNKSLSGDIGGGIGVEIGMRDDKPTVIRLLDGNPAKKAGVLAGDIIIKVNDDVVLNADTSTVASKIRGEVGTTVKLTVVRGDSEKVFDITRAKVVNPSVYSETRDNIGIIKVSRFDEDTALLVRNAAEKLKKEPVKGVILDLRGNGGGFLTAAQEVAGVWLDNKIVVSERVGGKETDVLRSGGDTVLQGMKTIVLVDGETASASEIVAGALRDHGVAQLVGVTTFGKGTVQKMVDLDAGSLLKVTVARWYTPNGKNLSAGGLKPDKKVGLSAEDVNAGKDPQLDAALAVFK